MSAAYDQSTAGNSGTSATASVSVTDAGAGELLLLTIIHHDASAITGSPSGGAGTWTRIGAVTQGSYTAEVWWGIASTHLTGTTVSVSLPASVAWSITVDAYTGADAAAPIDASNYGICASSTTPSLPVTTATAGALVVGMLLGSTLGGLGHGTGFTQASSVAGLSNEQILTEYDSSVTSAAGTTVTVGFTNTISQALPLFAIAIKAAGAGPPRRRRPQIIWHR